MATKNIHIVEEAGSGPFMDAYFDNLEGSGGSSYVLPAATTSTLGGVKKATAVSNAASVDASDIYETVNNLLAALRTAGVIENS